MRMTIASVLALALLAIPACKGSSSGEQGSSAEKGSSGGQTFEQAMAIVCSSPTESGAMDAALDQRAILVAKHVDDKVTNPDVVAMWKGLASSNTTSKHDTVAAAATKARIADCEILKMWPVAPAN